MNRIASPLPLASRGSALVLGASLLLLATTMVVSGLLLVHLAGHSDLAAGIPMLEAAVTASAPLADLIRALLDSSSSSSYNVTLVELQSVPIVSFPPSASAQEVADFFECLLQYRPSSADPNDASSFCGLSTTYYKPGSPVILRSPPHAGAAAAARWTRESFVRSVKTLPNVCVAKRDPRDPSAFLPFFYFDKKRPFMAAARSAWRDPFSVVPSMGASEFLHRDDVYFSAKVAEIAGFHSCPGLPEALQSIEELLPRPSVWITSPGMVSRLHFDAGDNLYFQIEGRKEFVLLPPSHHWAASLYPSLHPSARQSQVPLEDVLVREESSTLLRYREEWLAVANPLLGRAISDVRVASLQAGDVLFVPSFWLHHVSSLSHSFSLASFVQYLDAPLIASIFSFELPYLGPISELGEPQQQVILFELISLLISGSRVLSKRHDPLCNPSVDYCFLDQQGWLKMLLYSRYRLLPQDPMLGSGIADLVPSGDAAYACGDATIFKELPSFAKNDLVNAAQALSKLFLVLPLPQRHLLLADFVEQSSQLVLKTSLVHSYLVYCADRSPVSPPFTLLSDL